MTCFIKSFLTSEIIITRLSYNTIIVTIQYISNSIPNKNHLMCILTIIVIIIIIIIIENISQKWIKEQPISHLSLFHWISFVRKESISLCWPVRYLVNYKFRSPRVCDR